MTFHTKKDYLHWLHTREISLTKQANWAQEYLEKSLGKKFEVIRPRMPLGENAQYAEWKIWFERHLPFLRKESILIGNSLGGIFLARYLSEHRLQKKALSVFLICAPFDDTLGGEDLAGGFALRSDLSRIKENAAHIHLLFSKDDKVVPPAHAEKYRQKLPDAHIEIYKNKKGHFRVPTFPELIALIKADVRRGSKKRTR
jgi:predicted alpha/beta hydrolase family esterase